MNIGTVAVPLGYTLTITAGRGDGGGDTRAVMRRSSDAMVRNATVRRPG
jgi:hypothetical protein